MEIKERIKKEVLRKIQERNDMNKVKASIRDRVKPLLDEFLGKRVLKVDFSLTKAFRDKIDAVARECEKTPTTADKVRIFFKGGEFSIDADISLSYYVDKGDHKDVEYYGDVMCIGEIQRRSYTTTGILEKVITLEYPQLDAEEQYQQYKKTVELFILYNRERDKLDYSIKNSISIYAAEE